MQQQACRPQQPLQHPQHRQQQQQDLGLKRQQHQEQQHERRRSRLQQSRPLLPRQLLLRPARIPHSKQWPRQQGLVQQRRAATASPMPMRCVPAAMRPQKCWGRMQTRWCSSSSSSSHRQRKVLLQPRCGAWWHSSCPAGRAHGSSQCSSQHWLPSAVHNGRPCRHCQPSVCGQAGAWGSSRGSHTGRRRGQQCCRRSRHHCSHRHCCRCHRRRRCGQWWCQCQQRHKV